MVMSHKNVARVVIISLLVSICCPTIHTHTNRPQKNFKETTKNVGSLVYNAGKLYIALLLCNKIPEHLRGLLQKDGDESYPKRAFQALSFCASAFALIESAYTSYAAECQKNKDILLKAEIEQRYADYLEKK